MSDKTATSDTEVLQLHTAFVCPRCAVVYAADEGCSVCDYDGELDEFEVTARD